MKRFLDLMGLLFHLVLILSVAVVAYGSLRCLFAFLYIKEIGNFGHAALYILFFCGGLLVALGILILLGALIYKFYFESRNICPDCSGKGEIQNDNSLEKCANCNATGNFRSWKQTIDNSAQGTVQTPWWT